MSVEFDYPKFRKDVKGVLLSYLSSDDIKIQFYLDRLCVLYDSVPDSNDYARELCTDAADYLRSMYNAWKDDVRYNFDGRLFDGIEEQKKRREREIQIIRFTKSLFRKGMECGQEFI